MLEYLTFFLPIEANEKMTHALNVAAAEGWSMSRFEPEMGRVEVPMPDDWQSVKNVPGYRVVWVKSHGPVEGEGHPQHAHGVTQVISFDQLPPALKKMLVAIGDPRGFEPKPHKSHGKGEEPA